MHHLAGGAQVGLRRPAFAAMSTVVRSSSADLHLARDACASRSARRAGLVGVEARGDSAGWRAGRSGGSPRAPPGRSSPWSCRCAASRARSGRRIARRSRCAASAMASGACLHAVGSHVGDQADGLAADVDALVEPLRDLHGARWREAELARGLLLQGRGGEGRGGVALGRLRLDRATVKRRPRAPRLKASASSPCRGRTCELACRRRRPGGPRRSSPPASRASASTVQYSRVTKRLDLALAVEDQAQRHRLHAAGRARAGQLAPQHRREREADQIVQRAAGQVGVDQRAVDLRAGCAIASMTAALVIALKTTRSTAMSLSAFFSSAPPARARRWPRPRDRGRSRGSGGRRPSAPRRYR